MPSLADFRFEPDLARATTIPARWYTDPAMLPLEQERLFGGLLCEYLQH